MAPNRCACTYGFTGPQCERGTCPKIVGRKNGCSNLLIVTKKYLNSNIKYLNSSILLVK